MQIDVWTLLLQTLNLLVLLALLRWLFYKPLLAVIDQRRAAAAAALEKADAARRDAQSQAEALAQDRRQLESSRRKVLDLAAHQAEDARAAAQKKAEQVAEDALAEGRRRLADERHEAERQLREQAATLAVAMASQALRQLPGTETVALDTRFADIVLDELESHPAAERSGWFDDDAAHTATLATAAPLSEAARRKLESRLQSLLGADVTLAYETDPDLLAGAEMRFPHASIGHHWAGTLDGLRAHLAGSGATDEPAAA